MHPVSRSSASKTLLALYTTLLIPAAVTAAPQPLHFVSDQFGMVIEKIPIAVLNNHLERIPKCRLYFDYRLPRVQRFLVPAPNFTPAPKKPRSSAPNSREAR